MEPKPRHLLDTLTDSDWRLIAVALRGSPSPRASELAGQILDWRIQVAESEVRFLKAFAKLH